MEQNGISTKWSSLTEHQKKLIKAIICMAVILVCLICLTIFIIIQKDIRLVHCIRGKRHLPKMAKMQPTDTKKYEHHKHEPNTTTEEELARVKQFIVSVHYKHSDGRDTAFCIGSIVSSWWFVTSSICMHQRFAKIRIYTRAGSIYHHRGGSVHPLDYFVIPDWRMGTHDFYTYRYISLAKVTKPFYTENNVIVPAKFPKQYGKEDRFLADYDLYTFGWGTYISTEVKPKYKKLRVQNSQIYRPSVCKTYLQVDELKALRIIENILCAGNLKASKDRCNIDAGAPLTHMGIINGVSWSGTSCKNYPTVYSKVNLFADWALNFTNN